MNVTINPSDILKQLHTAIRDLEAARLRATSIDVDLPLMALPK